MYVELCHVGKGCIRGRLNEHPIPVQDDDVPDGQQQHQGGPLLPRHEARGQQAQRGDLGHS